MLHAFGNINTVHWHGWGYEPPSAPNITAAMERLRARVRPQTRPVDVWDLLAPAPPRRPTKRLYYSYDEDGKLCMSRRLRQALDYAGLTLDRIVIEGLLEATPYEQYEAAQKMKAIAKRYPAARPAEVLHMLVRGDLRH